jgi:hypothetical protein
MKERRDRLRNVAKALANDEQQTYVIYLIEDKYFQVVTMTYAIDNGIEYVEEVAPDEVL